ncbi:MAG TPA: hypothetical protein VJN90_02470 [Candidatus Acidoferrales bacterium]|nr:hypothetical protein [Candidatus Acidoferrales bacterium]
MPDAGGFSTAIRSVLAVVMSEDWRLALITLPFVKFVGLFAPFTVTTDVETKFDPLTVIVPNCPPAGILVGVIEEMAGTGDDVGVTVRAIVCEVPPPGAGVNTCTVMVPGTEMSPGLTCVVSSDGERKIVGGVPLAASRGIPLNEIVELGANPEPITISVNVTEFAGTLAGDSEATLGTGKLITPPQDASKIKAAIKSPVWILTRRFNYASPLSQ